MKHADLSHNYRLVVPTTIYNRVAPADVVERIRHQVKTTLAEAFGGYTEETGIGGYTAESGELIEEQVYIIEACYSEPNDEVVMKLAELIKTELQQESVMVRKDNEVYFV